MSEEELYNDIVEQLSSGNFLQLNGKAINLSELNDYINAQQQEIEKLTFESTKWESKFYDEAKKVDRAIEYIEKNSYTTIEAIDDINYFIVRLDKCADLLDILKGVDEE